MLIKYLALNDIKERKTAFLCYRLIIHGVQTEFNTVKVSILNHFLFVIPFWLFALGFASSGQRLTSENEAVLWTNDKSFSLYSRGQMQFIIFPPDRALKVSCSASDTDVFLSIYLKTISARRKQQWTQEMRVAGTWQSHSSPALPFSSSKWESIS